LLGTAVEDIQIKLEEHNMRTAMMKGSSFAKFFEKRIDTWQKWVRGTTDVIEIWLKVQQLWLSLESVFQSEDIMSQIPE
jgi:dynein heavy chain